MSPGRRREGEEGADAHARVCVTDFLLPFKCLLRQHYACNWHLVNVVIDHHFTRKTLAQQKHVIYRYGWKNWSTVLQHLLARAEHLESKRKAQSAVRQRAHA